MRKLKNKILYKLRKAFLPALVGAGMTFVLLWITGCLIAPFDVTRESPEKVIASEDVSIQTLSIAFHEVAEHVPHTELVDTKTSANLYDARNYTIYLTTPEGNEAHTPLTQCRLEVFTDANNTSLVRIINTEQQAHPYLIFNMTTEAFMSNVSENFMPGFSEGMQLFVYQYLAETLPVTLEANDGH